MTLTNWAAIAAKGTSHAVSISSTPDLQQQLPSSEKNAVETLRKSAGNIENESTCTVPSSSSSTSSNEEHSSPATTFTSSSSTLKEKVMTSNLHKAQVPTKPIPAPVPTKNPWKVHEIIRQREEKRDDHIAPDLLTPAESKDIKTVVTDGATVVAASLSSNAPPSTNTTNGKHATSSKKSKGTNHSDMNASNNGLQKNTSLKKTLQNNNETIANSKNESKESKDSSRKNTSVDKTKAKKNTSFSSQGMSNDNNSESKDQFDHRNTIHSSVSAKKKTIVSSSTSDNASSSNATCTSIKKKVPKQGATHMKSNISSNKTKTNNKTKKNANKKKNKSKGGQLNNNAYYYVPSPEEMEALKLAAVVQIEYFFSTDELVKNIYLRKQMDSEGYLPAAVVFNFPSVLSYCIPYYDLLAAVDRHAQTIEVDFENDCLRLKGGEAAYKKWLMPNPDGSLGCPKWIKEAPQCMEENGAVPLDTVEVASKGLNIDSFHKASDPMEEEKKEDDE